MACAAVLEWSGGYILWQLTGSATQALMYCRWLMVGAIAISVFYFHHLILLLEESRPRLLCFSYLTGLLFISIDIFTSGIVSGVRPQLNFAFWPVAGWCYLPLLSFLTAIIGTKLTLVYSAMKQSHGTRKSQLQYVFWGTVIAYVGGATNYPLWFGIPIPPYGNCGAAIYLVITSYAILKHRLMDITIIIRKTLTYSVVTGTLTILYLGIITAAAHLFEGLAGYQTFFSSAVAAVLVAICFQPLRKRVQTFIDSKFFRRYVDREEKLYELSREVITHTSAEAMGDALMRVLADTFYPKSGVLYVRSRTSGGFQAISLVNSSAVEVLMPDDNVLASYFADHPQPFVQDLSEDIGSSVNTRQSGSKERE